MKTIIKTYIATLLLLLAFTVQVSAQTKRTSTKDEAKTTRTTNTKKSTRTNNTKGTVSSRVSSTRVTYKKPTRKIVSVRSVPNRKVIKHKGQNYYYGNNKFYTQSRGRYIVIAPKVGFRINRLPVNYKRVRFGNRNYFNVQGVFYIQMDDQYEVVDPEIGTIVYELPNDYEKVIIGGLTYYEYANILYEKVQVDGTRAYEVVSIIEVE